MLLITSFGAMKSEMLTSDIPLRLAYQMRTYPLDTKYWCSLDIPGTHSCHWWYE
jgi:hypothetical protein